MDNIDNFPWFLIPVGISIAIIALNRKAIDKFEVIMHTSVGLVLAAMWFQGGFEVFLFGFVFVNLLYGGFVGGDRTSDSTPLSVFLAMTGAVIGVGWMAGEWVGVGYAAALLVIIFSAVLSANSKSN